MPPPMAPNSSGERGVAILNSFPAAISGSVTCLEAMRAQSPPRSDVADDDMELYGKTALDAQYRAWQANYPSALQSFDQLIQHAEGKQVAVFLDYDGTLSPIVEDPEKAVISEAMRAVVKEVASHFPTAIISGRSREKVYSFVQLEELYYAGSHGMDIMGPATTSSGAQSLDEAPSGTASSGRDDRGNDVIFFQPAKEFYPIMTNVFDKLQTETGKVEGAWVENNKFCITVHFRRVKEEKWETLANIVAAVISEFPQLRTTHGRKVLEVRPQVNWDKGKALGYLLNALGLERGEDVLPLYIGDDRTDEDAFGMLKERQFGCGIVVSTIAKSTCASYSLRDPAQVMDFLHRLVQWKGMLGKKEERH